ncbi:hybrid sensor histidine kinase/response regulator transcription factor [Neolewinella antarctica]|uniref:histidine kinase n=1 Tax=Neolewinella antarctica TaxID=442734 RepID=A0ABX0XGQ2_9BACT|nr:hybrid sensor histidine kinase/response regulator transcription factor [Neolewinella antarctica]NJC28377.1 signal transduction histidine kinase/DNA-binding response OmpR family regulator/ligand-binding sensor domain-containing protein [Neolewinella antarctica]
MSTRFLRTRTAYLLFYYLILSGPLLFAQSDGGGPDFFFEQFQLPRGLNGNHVQAVVQDSVGFMWFGSQSGLHRWDGYEMRTYLHDPDDSTSLASSYVEYLYVGKDGSLWVGTYGYGLDRFDYQREHFDHIEYATESPEIKDQGYVAGITEDRDGHLWVATYGGLYRYDLATGKSRRFLHQSDDYNSLSHNLSRVVYVDRQGTLWVGTGMPWENNEDGGLNRYRPETEDFVRYLHEPGDTAGLASNKVTAIFEDSRQRLWVGSGNNGLHLLDRPSDEISKVSGKLSDVLSRFYKNEQHVRFIFEDRDRRLWAGYWRGGITSVDLATGEESFYEYEFDDPNGLPEPYPWNIFQSRDGTLWSLTAGPNARVSKLLDNAWTVHPLPGLINDVTASGEARNGDLWLGNAKQELSRFNTRTYEITSVGAAGLIPKYPGEFVEDENGHLWMNNRTDGGVLRYDPASGQKWLYPHEASDESSLGPGMIMDIHQDRKGGIWIVTGLGYLCRYRPEIDGFSNYPILDVLGQDIITEYFIDVSNAADGGIWMIGSGFARDSLETTVRRFSPETGTVDLEVDAVPFSKYFSSDERIQQASSDLAGNLYLITDRHFIAIGPQGADKLVLDATHFGAEGFNDLMVDGQQRVWLTTDKVLLLDSDSEGFSVIATPGNYSDWVSQNGLGFYASSGKIYTGTDEGLLEIDPTKVGRVWDSGAAASMISDFALLVTGQDSSESVVTLPPRGSSLPIRLAHDQNAFSIHFGSPNFRTSEPGRQEIKLTGYDGIWRPAPSNGEANYLGLSPGKYTFAVRTANENGTWGPSSSLEIIVASPWWLTWWAYLAYLLLTAGVVTLIYRFQLKLRLNEEEARRIKELDSVRTRLYTNITHEFRTPLTVISGMAAQIESDPDRWLGEGLTMIERNAQRLLGLVNQLLDLSKLDNGSTRVDARRGDVVAYLRYVADSVNGLASLKNIGLHFYAEETGIEMDFDPEKLQQIFVNLLSNAVKFTPEEGNVYVTVRKLPAGDPASLPGNAPTLYLHVRDTGPGIPEDRLPYIFDRFYQADDSDTRRAEGTGIGLALTQELVRVLQGSIVVRSQFGQGTEFTVLLPVSTHVDTPVLTLAPVVSPTTPAPPPDLAPATSHYDPESKNPRVLLIEDNADVVAYLATCLGDDYELLVGRDGQEGLEIAREHIPDLVITDVMMPRKDGFSVSRDLKRDTLTSHIPVILLTAKADEQSKLTGLETGADAFLTKPFHRRELLLRVEKLIEGRARMRDYYRRVAGAKKSAPREAPKEENRREQEFVEQLRTTVEAHMNDYEFTVESFCKEVGMSSSQLHRKLTALTGLSPVRFIRYVRLARAKTLLETTDESIKVVAYDTGFSDPSYFSRSFKKEFGMTPMEYRDQLPARERGPE